MSLTKNIQSLGNFSSLEIATLEKDVFTEMEGERREWLVPNVKADFDSFSPLETQQINKCFSRIVAISLHMELPIGAFVRSLLDIEKQLPISAKIGLVKNIQDEEKHQLAFENVAKAYKVQEGDMKIANEYRKILVKCNVHPLIKSRDLETIVFIPLQTCLRYFGSQSLERLIGYISLDEFRHINYGWELSEILGLRFNKEFEEILIGVCDWAFTPLRDTKLNHKFWMQGVNEMRELGESPLFTDLMSYGLALAPFEISNNNY